VRPIRISRRLALAGGAAAALVAGSTFAQNVPAVPAPDDAPTTPKEQFVFEREPFVFHDEDVLFEREIVGPGAPFELAIPKIAPFPPHVGFRAFGPISGEALKQQLSHVKADRDFAQGKMDLTAVNALIQSAETLIGQVESKQPAQPTPVVESPRPGVMIRKLGPFAISREARQASAQLRAAGAQMEAALGGTLPSQAQRVSHELTMAHRFISESAAAARGNAAAADLATQAQALYKLAYDAYQAGQYDRAAAHARAALATAEAARAAVEPEPVKPSATPSAPPPPTF
jgi:hypothetical protein